MEYKITATLGPSSNVLSIWESMLSAGVTAFRLNTSHLNLSQLQEWLNNLEDYLSKKEPRPPLVLDLQGSKWRLGQFTAYELISGESVELLFANSTDRHNVLPVPHPDFFKAAAVSNGEIVLNDARIRMMVESVENESVLANITLGGFISPNKGITFSCCDYRQESLSKKDQEIINMTRYFEYVQYALSYVKDRAEMENYRELIGDNPYLIAKIERKSAIDEMNQIAKVTNEIWLCRGDLGAELGIAAMAETVYRFSNLVADYNIPIFLAGQVFEHMTNNPLPTRSEVCYLYEAINKGYGGIILSDETAIGQYPVDCCRSAAMFR